MKSIVIVLPVSILLAVFVAKLVMLALNLPTDPAWTLGAIVIATLLLVKRSPKEMVMIGFIIMLAEMHAHGLGTAQINADVLLAVLLTVMILPTSLDLMGIDHNFRRSRAM